MKSSIAFIGGGNMASSLIGGLLAASAQPDQILVSEPDRHKREQLQQQFNILTTSNNTETLSNDVVILAIKPQLLATVCQQLAPSLNEKTPLFVSIAAGVRSTDINRWLGDNQAIVRCMPNTPALLQCGATVLYGNDMASAAQKKIAEHILQSVGITIWANSENELDAVTAISGSGPAYFFLLMEAMQKAGEELGLDADTATKLTLQTALGAARMASESKLSPAELRAQVTSQGGTTEQAINSFKQSGFQRMVSDAVEAACERSRSLAEELGKNNHEQ